MSRTHQFLEDALMHRFGTLLVALTLGAVAPLALPAQTPTDLANVCKVLGDAKPGQWASFDGTGSSGVGKLRLASGLEAPRALVFKVGPQPAMRISGEMAGMMGKQGGQNASAFDWAGKCSGAHVVGWESVTVPAGTFRALHLTTEDGGDVWASRDVPFGLVKTHGKQGDLALTGRGADAKSSIAEKPMEMPGMAMPKD